MRTALVVPLLLIASSLVIVGCPSARSANGGASPTGEAASPPATSSKRADGVEEERSVILVEELAQIMDANKSDCEALADRLEDFNKREGREMRALEERVKRVKNDKTAWEQFTKKYGDRLRAAEKKMLGAKDCMKSNASSKAMKSEVP